MVCRCRAARIARLLRWLPHTVRRLPTGSQAAQEEAVGADVVRAGERALGLTVGREKQVARHLGRAQARETGGGRGKGVGGSSPEEGLRRRGYMLRLVCPCFPTYHRMLLDVMR